MEGINKIVNIRASMNNNLTKELQKAFPKVIPCERPKIELPMTLNIDPFWFVGFVDGEGCFSIHSNKNLTSVSFEFRINLHIDDIGVLKKIAKILGVGVVRINKDRNSAVFSVKKFDDIVRVILPIFQEFPLQTTKYLDFTCFSEAVLIKLNSESFGTKKIIRISETDLIKIKNLRANMNSGRLTIDKEQLDNLTKRVNINV
jgi:hypothetical protein